MFAFISCSLFVAEFREIVFIADRLHPLDVLAIERFLDGDVRHRRRGGRTVPMLVARRAPDDIARADLHLLLAFALRPAAARRDDERLPQRMRVPVGARTRLERHCRTGVTGRRGRRVERVDAHGSGKPLRRALGGRLRSCALEFHLDSFHCKEMVGPGRSTMPPVSCMAS
jgi:hypothetical protein